MVRWYQSKPARRAIALAKDVGDVVAPAVVRAVSKKVVDDLSSTVSNKLRRLKRKRESSGPPRNIGKRKLKRARTGDRYGGRQVRLTSGFIERPPKMRKPRTNQYLKYGMERIQETRGTVNDKDVVMLMSGPAPWDMVLTLCAAMLRHLLSLAGYELDDWKKDNLVFGGHIIKLTYRNDPNATTFSVVSYTNVTTTFEQWYIELAKVIVTSIGVTGTAPLQVLETRFGAMELKPGGNTTSDRWNAQFDCTKVNFVYHHKGVMMMQNRTPGAAATDTSVDDITANPLVYRKYMVKGNYAESRSFVDTGSVLDTVTLPGSGFVRTGTSATNDIGGGFKEKIGTSYTFKNTIGTNRGTIKPGGILKDKFSYYYDKPINWYIKLMQQWLCTRDSTAGALTNKLDRVNLGRSVLYQMEKACQVQADASSQAIILGYELNNITGGYCYKARDAMVRRLETVN